MTELTAFEQEVAAALIKGLLDYQGTGRAPKPEALAAIIPDVMEYLAPRVAAAIEAATHCTEGQHARQFSGYWIMTGDAEVKDAALRALRGEP